MFTYSVQLSLVLCVVLVQANAERSVKLQKLEKIREDDQIFQSQVELSDPDAEGHRLVSGDFKPQVTLDNKWKVKLMVYRTSSLDKEYVEFRNAPAIGFCDLMSSYYRTFFYAKLKDHSNAPAPDDCPLAPQEFHIKDYPLNSSQLKYFLSASYYRVVGQLLNAENEVKLEYRAEFQVE